MPTLNPYILTDKFTLNDNIFNLLYKGPSFIPHYVIPKCSYLHSINDFIRKLQWLFIIKNHSHIKSRVPLKRSSKWPADNLINKHLKTICDKIRYSCLNIINNSSNDINSADLNLANEIKSNANFKISKVDKGSNWVIISNTNYNHECYKQLNDKKFYNSLDQPRSILNKAKINRFANYLYRNKNISKKELNAVKVDNYINRKFYILPKIHKLNWSIPNHMPPGRPIINCANSECDIVGKLIDYYLKKIVFKLKSFVSDSFHFISRIENATLNENCFLFTLDIKSLYTNVPVDEALKAVEFYFKRHPDNSRPDSTLLHIISTILSNNDFYFNDNLYIQTKGIAMGQPFAPSIANIYVGLMEEQFLQSCSKTPLIWLRYIDDIFGIWEGTKDEFYAFISNLNNFNPHLDFTYTISYTSIEYLDLSVIISSCHLDYSISFKSSNSHTILHKTSNHPNHIFKGITYGQIRRWASLSSTVAAFDKACTTVFPVWRSRGYTRTELRKSKNKVIDNLGLRHIWQHSFHSCNNNCAVCPFTHTLSHIIINHAHFRVVGNYDCNSIGVVYAICCKSCQQFYIGQTERKFNDRLREHLDNIGNFNKKEKLYLHFRQCGTINFSCFILDKIPNAIKRIKKENFFINKFNTIYPNGLNIIANKKPEPTLILPYSNLSKKIVSNVRQILTKNNINFRNVFKLEKNLETIFKTG